MQPQPALTGAPARRELLLVAPYLLSVVFASSRLRAGAPVRAFLSVIGDFSPRWQYLPIPDWLIQPWRRERFVPSPPWCRSDVLVVVPRPADKFF